MVSAWYFLGALKGVKKKTDILLHLAFIFYYLILVEYAATR